MEDKLSKSFGLEDDGTYQKALQKTSSDIMKVPDLNSGDYDFVRDNMKDLISKGTGAIDDLMLLAKASEDPRVYRVLSELMSVIGTQNKELIDIEVKVKDSENKRQITDNSGNTNINNAIFVGSTKDLRKMIHGDVDE